MSEQVEDKIKLRNEKAKEKYRNDKAYRQYQHEYHKVKNRMKKECGDDEEAFKEKFKAWREQRKTELKQTVDSEIEDEE